MSDSRTATHDKIFQWLLDSLGRSASSWSPSQRAFLDSLLEGEEGTKTLVQMAVATARLRASGLKPEELGALHGMHEAMEEFWNDPCPETYEGLLTAGQSLDNES
jgi:hypothetical protein